MEMCQSPVYRIDLESRRGVKAPTGSNPVVSAIISIKSMLAWQNGYAADSYSAGRGFNSLGKYHSTLQETCKAKPNFVYER